MNHRDCIRYILAGLALPATAGTALAQEATEKGTDLISQPAATGNTNLYILVALIVFAIGLLLPVMRRFGRLGDAPAETFSWKKWWADIDARFLTKAIPVEKEADHLLDHNYDGIQELDNSLPPWWKWGFYISAVLSVAYILYYHVGSGMNPDQEYAAEMKQAAADIEAYRKASNDNVDEKTVTMADAAGVAKGKAIFQKNCFMCHGAAGEGGVGPNLTDEYWLHGGSINDVFKTIKFGYPDKGMQAWEKMLSPGEIRDIASYVRSLKGSKPANAKAPQGDLFDEAATVADSTSVAKK